MSKQVRVYVVLGALLALSPLPAALAQNGIATSGADVASLTPRIKIAMAGNKALKGSIINVDTVLNARTITLTGIVRSPEQKVLAGAISRYKTKGFQVQNHLVVRVEQTVPQSVPARFKRTGDFLQMLAKSQGRTDGTTFRQRVTSFPDATRLLWFDARHYPRGREPKQW